MNPKTEIYSSIFSCEQLISIFLSNLFTHHQLPFYAVLVTITFHATNYSPLLPSSLSADDFTWCLPEEVNTIIFPQLSTQPWHFQILLLPAEVALFLSWPCSPPPDSITHLYLEDFSSVAFFSSASLIFLIIIVSLKQKEK